MAVKKDERMVKSKKDKTKMVKKITYKCEGSYVDINGDSHRYHKRGFDTSTEAKEWERTFLLQAVGKVTNSLSFKELYEIFKETKRGKIKDRSFNDMEYLAKSLILPKMGDIKIKNITPKTIEDYQNYILSIEKNGKKYSNRYLESIQSQFKAVLRYGINAGYITDNRLITFSIAKRAGEIKKEMGFYTPQEFMRFISVVDSVEYYALYNVLYWCGTRLGETLALSWRDIDMDKRVIKISKSYSKHTHQTTSPKTDNSYRDVLIPEMCFNALERLKAAESAIIGFNEDSLVFYMDKHLDENAIRINKNKWCKQAGVKQIRIHDFRHSHVSLLINMGFSAFDIAKRLGHTVEMVNETYGHWFNEAQQTMLAKLDELSNQLMENTPNLHQI